MTILDAMHDPALFGPWFQDRESWRVWEVFLAGLFGLPFESEDAAVLFSRHTGGVYGDTERLRSERRER